MGVEAPDHINMVTTDLDRAESFFRDLRAFDSRRAPPRH